MYASKIIDNAKSFIGVVENPPNSNNVIFNKNYYGRPVNGLSYPWCVTFLWDVFRLSGASVLFYGGKKTAYCSSLEKWGRRDGLIVSEDKGDVGDIVLFDFNNKGIATHVGIIEKKNSDGSYTTIEGNTGLSSNENGGAVMRRIRNKSVIRCIIRPRYKKNDIINPKSVVEVQKYLNLKFKSGLDEDGSFGPLTKKNLIMYWQSIIGNDLSVDGSFGPNSQKQASINNLKRGDKGEVVRIMQMALICRGYSLRSYGADGSFGPYTEGKVKGFQKNNGLTVDGICGKNTWIALFK